MGIKLTQDVAAAKVPPGSKRSSQWPAVRRAHLKDHPKCELCDGVKFLEVHHIEPFHLNPAMELDPENLITLCENKKGGVNCHLLFGHLGSYRSFNINVRSDSAQWKTRLKGRPR